MYISQITHCLSKFYSVSKLSNICDFAFSFTRSKSQTLSHESGLINWRTVLSNTWNPLKSGTWPRAISSRLERETHAMDSNLTHTPTLVYLTLELLTCVLSVQTESDAGLQLEFNPTDDELSDAERIVMSLSGSSGCLLHHVRLCK